MAKAQAFTCEGTGVRLKITAPSSLAMIEAQKLHARQKPMAPVVFVEAKGRDEPNEDDPVYRAALAEWSTNSLTRSLISLVITGTELVKKPDDMPGPDDEEFIEYLDSVGIIADQRKAARYAQWVMYCAARHKDDWPSLTTVLLRTAGIPEDEVAVALESFPGDTERGADTPALAE